MVPPHKTRRSLPLLLTSVFSLSISYAQIPCHNTNLTNIEKNLHFSKIFATKQQKITYKRLIFISIPDSASVCHLSQVRSAEAGKCTCTPEKTGLRMHLHPCKATGILTYDTGQILSDLFFCAPPTSALEPFPRQGILQ